MNRGCDRKRLSEQAKTRKSRNIFGAIEGIRFEVTTLIAATEAAHLSEATRDELTSVPSLMISNLRSSASNLQPPTSNLRLRKLSLARE